MSQSFAEIIDTDIERVFADWGVAATLQIVDQTYLPETQTISETVEELAVTVLESEAAGQMGRTLGGQGLSTQQRVWMKCVDFPGTELDSQMRLIVRDTVWGIHSRRSVWNGVLMEVELVRLEVET